MVETVKRDTPVQQSSVNKFVQDWSASIGKVQDSIDPTTTKIIAILTNIARPWTSNDSELTQLLINFSYFHLSYDYMNKASQDIKLTPLAKLGNATAVATFAMTILSPSYQHPLKVFLTGAVLPYFICEGMRSVYSFLTNNIAGNPSAPSLSAPTPKIFDTDPEEASSDSPHETDQG